MSHTPKHQSPAAPQATGPLWALEATTDNVILLDRDFRITYINKATAALNQITQESVLGQTIWETWPGNVGTDIEKNYRHAMENGVPVRFEHGYFERDRFNLWLEIHAYPSPDGLAIFFHDITEAKRVMQLKAEDERRLARAIEATDLGVWRVNLPLDGSPFYLSSQVRRHFGISEDEEVTMDEFVALLHPDDVQPTADAIRRAIDEGVAYDVVYRTIAHDGKTRWVRAYGNAFYQEDGTPYQFDGYTLDYTERVETERELRDAKARIDATLASADVGTWMLDVASDQINGDANLARLFGLTSEEALVGSAAVYLSKIHPEDQPSVVAALAVSLEKGLAYSTEYRVLAGEAERWVVARGVPERDITGVVARLSGVVIDISDLKSAQMRERVALEAMRESEERFRRLVELSPSTIWFAELDGGLSYISQDFYESSGLTPETALPNGWASTVHPDDLPRTMAAWQAALRNETDYDTEFRIRNREGEYRWIIARARPVRDEVGKVTGWLGSNSDIQERKGIEETLRDLVSARTSELERAIAEAEAFNYSISHDLRSPLRGIVSTSSMLLEEAGPELQAIHRKLLERQVYNATKLANLIDELLRLSRLSRVEVRRVTLDLSANAQEVVADLETPCRFEIEEGLQAEGDPALVRTVLQNLIENACKFSPVGGTIRVGKEDHAFYVRDEGLGFDMHFASKIFLPFERLVTDDEFPGTGIGLANVKRIVERHGGDVWAKSEPGCGATFFFTLQPNR